MRTLTPVGEVAAIFEVATAISVQILMVLKDRSHTQGTNYQDKRQRPLEHMKCYWQERYGSQRIPRRVTTVARILKKRRGADRRHANCVRGDPD